jgi:hypothetical protein
MSDKAEELAKQLLEKTKSGKLRWTFVTETASGRDGFDGEKYRTDLDGGFSFFISRQSNGDDKTLALELAQPGRVVLSAQTRNFSFVGPKTQELREIRNRQSSLDKLAIFSAPLEEATIARFRLFSDLFYAARKSAVVEDQTIEKVQQLLEKLG